MTVVRGLELYHFRGEGRNRPIMARRKTTAPTPTNPAMTNPATMPADLRDRILADFAALKVSLTADAFDTVLARAEREGLVVRVRKFDGQFD
jgi:hypothetical protein